MASIRQEAFAETKGFEAAETFLGETPRGMWDAAVSPAEEGADATLINSLGRAGALSFLGCDDPKDADSLLGAYARGFGNRVAEAIQETPL